MSNNEHLNLSLYIYIYIVQVVRAVAWQQYKQSLNDVRQGKVARQQQVGRQTGVRLEIARNNTARILEVETYEERRNRLQLLQQNGAMYRENDRLKHQQDQNNRESYLSNGWRNAEQPLHEQQWVQTDMALVDFQHYTGPPFLHTHPQIVPIPPHLFELWETEGQRLSRQQLPLRLSYAMTIHKSQG